MSNKKPMLRKHMMKIPVFDEICLIMVESKNVIIARPALKFIPSMFCLLRKVIDYPVLDSICCCGFLFCLIE